MRFFIERMGIWLNTTPQQFLQHLQTEIGSQIQYLQEQVFLRRPARFIDLLSSSSSVSVPSRMISPTCLSISMTSQRAASAGTNWFIRLGNRAARNTFRSHSSSSPPASKRRQDRTCNGVRLALNLTGEHFLIDFD